MEFDERGDPMSFTRYGSLKGRTVIITGGASRIGASFVRAFVAGRNDGVSPIADGERPLWLQRR